MLVRVDHIDLKVPDVEETVAFFKKLGFEERRRTDPPRHSVEVALPGDNQVVFEVRPAGTSGKHGVDHIAFRVGDSGEQQAIDELKAAGITFDRELNFVKDTGRTVSNFRDAGGLRWQLTD